MFVYVFDVVRGWVGVGEGVEVVEEGGVGVVGYEFVGGGCVCILRN